MRAALLLVAALAAGGARSQPADSLAARLDAAVRAYHDAGRFDGVVLVVEGGPDDVRVLYEGAFGLADRAWGVPMTPDVRFPFASITKQVAAVMAHQFEMDGLLDLDAPVARYVPGLVAGGDSVLVRHLLNHSSGLPFISETEAEDVAPYGCPIYEVAADSLADPVELVRQFASGPLQSVPGETVRYSNTDTIVLQAVMEAVTGEPFESLLQARILDPLGMADSGLLRPDTVVERLVETYEGDGPPGCFATWRLGAAGAMVGTAADLARFDLALMAGAILPPERLVELWASSPETTYAAQGAWSYPKTVGEARVRVIERTGLIAPFNGLNVLLPESGRAIVVLKSAGDADLFALSYRPGLPDDLVRVLFGQPTTGLAND